MADKVVNVIFGSEFDGSGVSAGVNDLVEQLEKAKEAEEALKEEVAALNSELEKNEKAIQDTNKQIALIGRTTDKNSASFKKLNSDLDAMKKRNQELNSQLAAGKKQLEIASKTVTNFSNAQKTATKNTSELSKTFSKWTNAQTLGAKIADDYGKAIFKVGKAMLEGFAIGIAVQAVPALLQFLNVMTNAGGAMNEYQKQAKLAGEIQSRASEIFANDVGRLELFRRKLVDTNIPQKERVRLAQDYNKTAEEGNRIDVTQINNLDYINKQIDQQIKLLKQRATARAAEAVIAERAEAVFKRQIDLETRFPQFGEKRIQELTTLAENAANAQAQLLGLGKVDIQELFAFADLPENVIREQAQKNSRLRVLLDDRTRQFIATQAAQLRLIETARSGERVSEAGLRTAVKDLEEARKEFERALRVGVELVDIEGLLSSDIRNVQNIFEQKLAELRARLAEVSAAAFQSEPLIRQQFAAKLEREFKEIANFVRNKQLTNEQAEILKGLLRQINDIELTRGLEEFRKKREEAVQKINEQLLNLQIEAATKRIQNLQGEFERERETIELESRRTIQGITRQQEQLFRSIDEQVKHGLLDVATAENKKAILNAIFGDLLDQTEQERLRRQAELAFKQFNNFLQQLRNQYENVGIGLAEATTREIQEASQQYLRGEISYEKYQKKLTEIAQRETRNRRNLQLQALNEELDQVNRRLQQEGNEQVRRQLEERQRALRGQISTLQREIATGGAQEDHDAERERLDNLVKYVEAVGNLASAVLNFWQQVNQAEAAALDRSIAYQQRRVEFARQIAEKGNAEFLEEEQKRLDELERKREQNANRQLAINNALTASQALVAAVSAIAQAVSTGSPFAAIAAVAAVIGAIGAAYQFVNSLQPPVQQFAEGSEYVELRGNRPGIDTVPARLTVGERVVTKRENSDYWDTLHAIHNRAIPPDVLNDFVNRYPVTSVPQVDFERLNAATSTVGADSAEVVQELKRTREKLDEVVNAVAAIGVNVKMDSEGFAGSITTHLRKKKLWKKA